MYDKDTINNMRAEIASVIQAQTTILKSVHAYPQPTLDGFPAAIVRPSDNQSDYSTNKDNRVVFAFTVDVYYPALKDDYAKTETAIGEAMGELLRIFSQRHPLTTCDWVLPVPGIWTDTTIADQPMRVGTITVRCQKYVDKYVA